LRIHKKLATFGALAAVSSLALTACGDAGANASTATGEPIVVASVNALSGPATFPEASAAAKAVFDDYNAAGGLDGRPIQYEILDDKADPAAATAAARDAVGKNAVAMVGSASLLDCEINSKYYETEGIVSIQGTGVDPFCFTSPNVSPVNTGPYVDTTLTLTYGSETLGLEKICGLLAIAGSTRPAYQAAIDEWTKATGKSFAFIDDTVPYGGADYTPYVIKAKEAGCDGIYVNAVEPEAAGLLKAAEAQGMNDMTFLLLTSTYSAQFAEAANFVGKGVYVPAEFAPFTVDGVAANTEWAGVMEKHKVDQSAFAQGGYLAAKNFITMIESMDGDITKETVTKAFKAQTEGNASDMAGDPWIFGDGASHSSNRSGWPITIAPGSNKWTSVADDWTRLG
jgi:branched-chain amino acid transport system substrate-binding protein